MTEKNTEQLAKKVKAVKHVQGVSRALLIYGLLLGGAVVFSLPFVWMIGTSFKVDREMFGEKITLWPMQPVPAKASPYLDDRYYPTPDSEDFARVQETIREAIEATNINLPDEAHGRESAVDILAPGVFKRLQQILPTAAWNLPDEALRTEIRSRVTAAMVQDLTTKIYRHLSLGSVRVRSHDLQEADVTEGCPISEFWTVEGPAQLVDGKSTDTPYADLVYSFENDEEQRVELSKTIDLPFQADRLFRVQLFLQPDDSWHPVEFYIERNGKRFKGKRPEFMGNFQWSVIALQAYGPDDESNKIRLWIPVEQIDEGDGYESRPDKVKVSMVLERTDQVGAWWAKCQKNYRGSLDYIPFWRYASTSALLVILNIIGNVFSCSLVAYSFARLQWPGRNLSFGLMLATMMIPPQVVMIPYFLIIKHLGWYNTLKPLWVLSFFGNAFNIFLLRQFMKGIPRDLEDAARIDGCNFMQVYWYVIMPLIKPTLACIAIFTFMGVWNDFMGPLIYLNDQRLYPLSLGLYAFNVQAGGNYGMMMAGSLMMTLPVVVIFFFAQKYFIQGVTLTGMKG